MCQIHNLNTYFFSELILIMNAIAKPRIINPLPTGILKPEKSTFNPILSIYALGSIIMEIPNVQKHMLNK